MTTNKGQKIGEKGDHDDDDDDDDKPSRSWKFIADDGGVCQHLFEFEILTKLNKNEIKFLYGTNTESRLAIKRAKIKLSKKFRIHELSSISQLELAWANFQWGGKAKYSDNGVEFTKNQEMFCCQVANTNDLALLRWVREVKECAWDWITTGIAASKGNLEMLKYCVENGCEVHERVCAAAASEGHLECLKYLRVKNVKWDWRTSGAAAILGNLEMLKYCVENGCEVHEGTCAEAAKFGTLECLKYLRVKNVKWDHRTVQCARENNHVECLNYALANNCPQTLEEWEALQSDSEEEEDEDEEDEEEEEEEEMRETS